MAIARDHAQPVAVAVEGEPEIVPAALQERDQVAEVLRLPDLRRK